MARENQDLQIALIISVMLTIILGVATFLCYRQYTDTAKSLQAKETEAKKKNDDAEKARNEVNQLKRYLGVAESDSIEGVSKQFDDDMKKFGPYSPEALFYRPLVANLVLKIQEKENDLDIVTKENVQLKNKYEVREAGKDAQLKEFTETVNRVKQDLQARTESFQKDRDRLTEESTKIKDQLQSVQKDAAAQYTKVATQYQETDDQLKKTRQLAKQLRQENAGLTNQVMDNPDGEIRWVNQRNGTVWIDVGWADNLNALTTFAVYPADITNLGKGAKKADIEVTQILGNHLAEARILEDKHTDPIMPGDKINTPIWTPGDKRHFALIGTMDVNSDGKNNIQLLRNLINMNGGVVDCSVDDNGNQVGEISIQTRFLVHGEKPGEKEDPKKVEAYSKIMGEAQNLGIQIISLKELLERMGYKPQSHVVSFGLGANPNDFKPKPESGVNRVSTGSVSDIYKPRETPRSGAGGAY